MTSVNLTPQTAARRTGSELRNLRSSETFPRRRLVSFELFVSCVNGAVPPFVPLRKKDNKNSRVRLIDLYMIERERVNERETSRE